LKIADFGSTGSSTALPVRHHTPRPAIGRCAMVSSFPWPAWMPWSLLDAFELQGFNDRVRALDLPTELLIAELNNGAGAGPLLLQVLIEQLHIELNNTRAAGSREKRPMHCRGGGQPSTLPSVLRARRRSHFSRRSFL